ncbi:uncharacterized protein LOC124795367 isoform X1 [Schistocerca piceifrons]|uniref:uncharacterized protein LOC124795367 isoform X1 n=1 Tax=Schistocerca piceifrons TaxID=274613 RepID=UPI001F5FC24F|nr:uncharacterized protein LOC124795367 isoform X1 [Schistocerca piceifrons]
MEDTKASAPSSATTVKTNAAATQPKKEDTATPSVSAEGMGLPLMQVCCLLNRERNGRHIGTVKCTSCSHEDVDLVRPQLLLSASARPPSFLHQFHPSTSARRALRSSVPFCSIAP